jgi:hypothetical protein
MIRCDGIDLAHCPAYRANWRLGDEDRCDPWGGFQEQAMRDLGVTEWTEDVDPAAKVLFVRWREAAAWCTEAVARACAADVCSRVPVEGGAR